MPERKRVLRRVRIQRGRTDVLHRFRWVEAQRPGDFRRDLALCLAQCRVARQLLFGHVILRGEDFHPGVVSAQPNPWNGSPAIRKNTEPNQTLLHPAYRQTRGTVMLGLYGLAAKFRGEKMPRDVQFEGCDAATVFAEVGSAINSEEMQSLWDRLLGEMGKDRVDGAVSYLSDEFQRLAENLDRELNRLEAER